VSHWSDFIDTMTGARADRIRSFMIQMRTKEGMEEVVDCMMCAVHMLAGPGGKDLAERLAAREAGMPSETYLDGIAESVTQCRWVVEHHVGTGEGRQRCAICETWWPCDLVSVAATAVLLADRVGRLEVPDIISERAPAPGHMGA
jgi:hypothetical protein